MGFGGNSHLVSAKESSNELLNDQKELAQASNLNIDINVMNEDEIRSTTNKENNVDEIFETKQQIISDGFVEIEIGNEESKLKYVSEDDKELYVHIITRAYENTETKEVIVTQTIFDGANNEIEQFLAEKSSTDNPEENIQLVNYTNPIPQIQTFDFSFNGKSFVCSVAGLLACGQYCGIWALVNPIAGGTCAGVCGIAFAAACAFA